MELLIIIVLLVIAAETTYLFAQSAQKVSYKKYTQPVFVDTSVLIDGRILAVAQSGFITSTLLIPRSVVGELQLLADQADHDRRTRARKGLDLVSELLALPTVKAQIFADKSPASEGVDNRLLSLARKYKGSICTIDYNLNKVAQVEDIPVLNVNDLARTLRMAYLPGEKIMLELTQKGNESHQAVGHLIDGTMVVVEQASARIGQTVEIEFIRSLQTAAGKMMFAKIVSAQQASKKTQKPSGTKPQPTNGDQKKTQPKQSRQPKPAIQAQSQGQKKRPNNRRRTHEDSLVELANKIGE